MRIHFKMNEGLLSSVREDLLRPHEHAAERIGFLSCGFGTTDEGLLIVACKYHPVEDGHYERDPLVGARFGSAAMREALQIALTSRRGIFHIHCHDHVGEPRPSRVDSVEWVRFIPDFWHVRPELPHGALLLSEDRMRGWCWFPKENGPLKISQFSVVGARLRFWEAS